MNLRWLAVVLMCHVLLWLLLKPPVPHSDDRVYVEEGYRMASSSYTVSESPKSHRLLVIIPVAVLVAWFGDSPFVISLWPLLCSLMTVAGVFLLFRKNLWIATAASVLISCNIIQVIYSSVAFPDAVVSFFAFIAVALVQLRNQNSVWSGLAVAATLLAGFFAKQIMLLVIPFLLFVSLEDFRKGANQKFWKVFYFSSAVIALSVLAVSKSVADSWFFLLRSVETHHNDVFVNLTGSELMYRLTAEPLVFLFSHAGYWPLLLMAWPAWFLKNEFVGFWKRYAVIMLLLLWLATTSFHRWAPLPLLDRMWMLLIVPFSILSSFSISALLRNRLTGKAKMVFYGLFVASALAALPAFHAMRMLMLLMFPLFFWLAEKQAARTGNQPSALMIALFPYFILAVWFAVNNTHW